MVTKLVMCPQCKHQVTVQGDPGEKIYVLCPQCGLKGVFTFPEVKSFGSSSFAIEIRGLTKSFNGFKAVDNVSFTVKKGEIFGFLGPNGAGKSTTIKAILGLIRMDSGDVKINGFDVVKNGKEAKKYVGYLPERVAFYDNLTPLQTLHFFCELKGEDPSVVKPLIHEVGLENVADRKIGTFSKGMLQLLGIAQTMIGDPPIYILDEPMVGLDARWVKIIRDKIKMLNEKGATIFFSSHILTEVQNLCDRVAVIYKGRLVAEDTVSHLSTYLHIKSRLELYIPGLNGRIPEVLHGVEGVEQVDVKKDTLFITCEPSARVNVIAVLKEAGIEIKNIKTIDPSLEEAFVKLISQEGDVV